MRIFNWYLYTYLICAAAMSRRRVVAVQDRRPDRRAAAAARRRCCRRAPSILLFLLLNIEIADFYATGPTIMFRFGVSVSQDLTYTIGWLVFGMVLLAVGHLPQQPAARVAALR